MSFQKVAGIAGLVFAGLLLANALVSGSPPAGDASAAKVAQYVADHESGIKLAVAAASLGSLFAILWVAGIFERLRAAGGEARSWALVALLGLIFAGVLSGVANAASGVLVSGGRGLDAPTVLALWKTTWVDTALLGVVQGAALLGFGLARLRGGGGAKWLSYLALVAAVLSIVGGVAPTEVADGSFLGFMVFGGFLLFVVVVVVSSIEMVRSPGLPAAV